MSKYSQKNISLSKMPLSRLENFLKNVEGNILYVNLPTLIFDSIENRGNSLTRPFKTIRRALMKTRFSYQTNKNNDKIDRTTILTFPGTHYIDNKETWIYRNR